MMFFKVIFYFIGLIFVFIELVKLGKLDEYVRKVTDYMGWIKMRKKKDESTDRDDTPEEFKSFMMVLTIYYISELAWLGIGLFTFNWVFILTYFALMMIVSKLTPKKKTYSKGLVGWTGFWILFNISFYMFLIINTFHLHINFLDLF